MSQHISFVFSTFFTVHTQVNQTGSIRIQRYYIDNSSTKLFFQVSLFKFNLAGKAKDEIVYVLLVVHNIIQSNIIITNFKIHSSHYNSITFVVFSKYSS